MMWVNAVSLARSRLLRLYHQFTLKPSLQRKATSPLSQGQAGCWCWCRCSAGRCLAGQELWVLAPQAAAGKGSGGSGRAAGPMSPGCLGGVLVAKQQ